MESSLKEAFLYPDEPFGAWTTQDFQRFALWCCGQSGISDINLIVGDKIWIRRHGCWMKITRGSISANSIFGIVDDISRDTSASSKIRGSRYLDFVYLLRADRKVTKRFRCNATGCRDMNGSNSGVNLVMRLIPTLPPTLEELDVEPEIIANCKPHNGLVLVTGVMGEGKSTLLSAILRNIRETQDRYICTVEDPIEFDLLEVPNARGPITQSEIGQHLLSFTDSPRNTARRAVDVLLVGESRDTETLKGMLVSAEMGMAVYTTVHTKNVAETFGRIISVFPSDQWNFITTMLINSIRIIIQQPLLQRKSGGRIAIREYLVFTSEHKKMLLKTPIERLSYTIQNMVEKDGVSLERSENRIYEEGFISLETYEKIKMEEGS